ncbi:uncharacterized protein CCOS01_00168 [Colletotrichum costaricense]|uniref:Uncharacterized protein n=1 Tax=Colletotrichum costaricense TaxID=1209916 RepID=A0AAI9Z8S2_9PEZI|nr:uncharacterized protein CCOS01_00168 [Colletotrichum costaricense]KAK1538854.1 hypothetical protein CCOS01_00168 [Colletotrichum costaricense]
MLSTSHVYSHTLHRTCLASCRAWPCHFPLGRTGTAHLLQVPFPPIFAHPKQVGTRFSPFIRFFPFCVHFHVRPPSPPFSSYPHHNRPAPSLPLPSPLSTLPTSHRFLPPNPSFPPTSHSHDSDPLLIRSSKGAEDSRS